MTIITAITLITDVGGAERRRQSFCLFESSGIDKHYFDKCRPTEKTLIHPFFAYRDVTKKLRVDVYEAWEILSRSNIGEDKKKGIFFPQEIREKWTLICVAKRADEISMTNQ